MPSSLNRLKSGTVTATKVVRHHVKRHAGVGVILAVAYFDPGNWSVDLQAGTQFGYKLLFVVLLAGLGAVLLQSLACKLGCVTGLDLAAHCRLLLYNNSRYPRLCRWMLLYPLYALSEVAIIATDLAELLGTAIALKLLIPPLPLWAGVLTTAVDVLVILWIGDPSRGKGRPVRTFEFIIIGLVLAIFICFIILITKVSIAWSHVFEGYLPSRTIVNSDALYLSIGILGATVMPHGIYLGSSLATLDRVTDAEIELPVATSVSSASPESGTLQRLRKSLRNVFRSTRVSVENGGRDLDTKHGERDNNSQAFVKAHLHHGVVDIIMSLLGFAVLINSAILILAAAVFFDATTTTVTPTGLADAYSLIMTHIGKAPAILFAVALLCCGLSASITATLAGQIVSEGFIAWRFSPFLRRIVTRCLSLIPAMIVAIASGERGINTLLVASQVVLSVVLPFVVFPLIWLTSSKSVMRVRKPGTLTGEHHEKGAVKSSDSATVQPCSDDYVDYSNHFVTSIVAWLLFVVVVTANAYVLVSLIIGARQ